MNTELTLCDAWEQESKNWVQWARTPGHDSYWKFHRDQFLELVPRPGQLTVDIGCGEGRLTRHLRELGHVVRSFDASKSMLDAAREADSSGSYELARAESLPLENGAADLAIVFMVLQDVDDLSGAVKELSRILKTGGRACIAIVHPINSAGKFAGRTEDSEFTIRGSYLEDFRYADSFDRNGLQVTFHSLHRPIERFSREFERAGLCIEAIREHSVPDSVCSNSPDSRRWQRVPLFLHFRLIKI